MFVWMFIDDMDMLQVQFDVWFIFDNFVVGKLNEFVYVVVCCVVEGGLVIFNLLFLYGGVGLGKIYLMYVVVYEICCCDLLFLVVYLFVEQFMYKFILVLKDCKMIDFKQMFCLVDVLMVDDVQFIVGKDSIQEEFFYIFNVLVEVCK